ncbi:MAG: hypothetical protein IJ785_05215 [Bacteroidales bacterium]|nr:hypothetical protein [Bacteroidales bacterium]
MIKLEKTYGVRGVANDITLFRIQELIAIEKQQVGLVGKAVIDTEKITFYKFGLKLSVCRFATNGLVINEEGIIRYAGTDVPAIYSKDILRDVYALFGKPCTL